MMPNSATQKTESVVDTARIAYLRRTRFNPLRGLDPMRLSRYIDAYRVGRLRDFALAAFEIGERDDTLSSVIPKREKQIGRHGWEILKVKTEREKQAALHAEALEAFYNNIRCENAWEPEEQGGWAMLCRTMLRSVGMRRSVHEIVWRPKPRDLRATFRHVPLWFFEMETGRLRYLKSEKETAGTPLDPGEWMVTTGDGLMVASAILYMFKSMPLRDWVSYTEKFGFPLPHLGIHASPDSAEWRSAEQALAGIINDSAFLYNNAGGAHFGVASFGAAGELPFEKLIERCDRRMAALWRGADLSTISQTSGVGVEAQSGEAGILEEDDAMSIEEALEQYVSRHVIEWYFGAGVEPLAYIKVKTGANKDLDKEQQRLDRAVQRGVAIAAKDYRESLQLPTPQVGDALVGGGKFVDDASYTPPAPVAGQDNTWAAGNSLDPAALERYIASGEERIGEVLLDSHGDLLELLRRASAAETEEEMRAILAEAAARIPDEFAGAIEALTRTFQAIEGTAVVEGAIQGHISRK
jgi:phage gp29-like protein